MVPLPAVSSEECVEALTLAGFRLIKRTDKATVLARNYTTITVPQAVLLDGVTLDKILRAAHVSPTRFLDLLSEPTTETDRGLEKWESGARPIHHHEREAG